MDLLNLFLNLMFGIEVFSLLDILKDKNVGNVININCSTQKKMLMHKLLNYHNIKVATLDIQNYNGFIIPNTNNKLGILLNASCPNWQRVLDNICGSDAFKNQRIWLIYTDDLQTTTNILSKFSIELDSDVTVLFKHEDIYELYEVYRADYSKGNFVVKKIGYWNKTLNAIKTPRTDLSGITIKSTVVITDKIKEETFMDYFTTRKRNKVDSLHKLKYFELLTYIRDMYNFSYDLQRTNSWGYVRNGSFDGIVGALHRQESEVGGSSMFFRADRAKLVDYVAETWEARQCFILRHPKHPGGIYSIYTRPLSVKVWYCILGMLVISGVILCMMLKTKSTKSREDAFDSSLSLALLFVWSAVCQQGMSLSRNSTSVQVVVFVTFVYAVTLYQYYNATVVSTLLREPPKNIRTLEDLLKSNLKAGLEDVVYVKDYFKRTTNRIDISLYRKKIVSDRHSNFFTPERGMALVKAGGFAFHVDSVVAYRIMRSTFTEREICEAHEVLLYPPQKMGVAMRKLSPYREYFKYGVRRIFESGLMDRLRSVWDEPKPPCVRMPDTSVFSVSILEFSTVLISLTTGTIIAVIVLIGEIIVHKVTSQQNIMFRH